MTSIVRSLRWPVQQRSVRRPRSSPTARPMARLLSLAILLSVPPQSPFPVLMVTAIPMFALPSKHRSPRPQEHLRFPWYGRLVSGPWRKYKHSSVLACMCIMHIPTKQTYVSSPRCRICKQLRARILPLSVRSRNLSCEHKRLLSLPLGVLLSLP
jgi:hypothetical protein